MDTFATNAAEYCTTGDKRVGAGTLVVLSSVTGTTTEIVDAVRLAQSHGAKVLGFIDKPDAELATLVDYCISYHDLITMPRRNEVILFDAVKPIRCHNIPTLDRTSVLF
mgnify:CR=1 FL=1